MDGRCVLYLACCACLSAKAVHFHMSSFNENTGLSHLRNTPVEWVKYPFMFAPLSFSLFGLCVGILNDKVTTHRTYICIEKYLKYY